MLRILCSTAVIWLLSCCIAEGIFLPRFLKYIPQQKLSGGYNYETKYFEQKIDHFAFPNPGTYKMRYLVNEDHWDRDSGPIFFYTGNEGDVTAFANNTGFMWDIAPEFKAKLLFAEHRYYGQSLPFGKQSYKRENLRYFTSEQALADFAVFLESVNPERRPVILFGGSYGGMLSAWMRMKYPHLVAGAIAGSAPIWQFPGLTDCGVFNRIVSTDFAQANTNCPRNVRETWAVIDKLGADAAGRDKLRALLRLCKPLASSDMDKVKTWLLNVYGNLAMVNYPYPTTFLEPLPAWPVKAFCSHLSEASYSPDQLLSQLLQGLNVYFNSSGTTHCLDINSMDAGGLDDMGWDYQSCTEMVMPMCADGVHDMFQPYKWDLPAFTKYCQGKYGVTPDPDWIQTHYADKHIEASSNIVFSNGDLDPWSGGGVLKTVRPSLPAVRIPGAAHHLDLRGKDPSDSSYIRSARRQHRQHITTWIHEWDSGRVDTTLKFQPSL